MKVCAIHTCQSVECKIFTYVECIFNVTKTEQHLLKMSMYSLKHSLRLVQLKQQQHMFRYIFTVYIKISYITCRYDYKLIVL